MSFPPPVEPLWASCRRGVDGGDRALSLSAPGPGLEVSVLCVGGEQG